MLEQDPQFREAVADLIVNKSIKIEIEKVLSYKSSVAFHASYSVSSNGKI
jgi:hypothetical protein